MQLVDLKAAEDYNIKYLKLICSHLNFRIKSDIFYMSSNVSAQFFLNILYTVLIYIERENTFYFKFVTM